MSESGSQPSTNCQFHACITSLTGGKQKPFPRLQISVCRTAGQPARARKPSGRCGLHQVLSTEHPCLQAPAAPAHCYLHLGAASTLHCCLCCFLCVCSSLMMAPTHSLSSRYTNTSPSFLRKATYYKELLFSPLFTMTIISVRHLSLSLPHAS